MPDPQWTIHVCGNDTCDWQGIDPFVCRCGYHAVPVRVVPADDAMTRSAHQPAEITDDMIERVLRVRYGYARAWPGRRASIRLELEAALEAAHTQRKDGDDA